MLHAAHDVFYWIPSLSSHIAQSYRHSERSHLLALYTSSLGSSVPLEEGAAPDRASEASSCGFEEDASPTAGVAEASPLSAVSSTSILSSSPIGPSSLAFAASSSASPSPTSSCV
ncbi:hypothetical protein EYF80_002990 [Liparis tanakae]|uniref:Uncharacterized protein n=1 Tax=Liparis tanakae TaxID=230148 RepID=A0A4Z2J9T4_9TELE|nr:hypothetical protein EYF80_002990 [Liparis tanakae]